MANFNDFDDVRHWLGGRDVSVLREQVTSSAFGAKSLEVAKAYIAHIEEHGYDALDETLEGEDDEPRWTWNVWRAVIVAAFVIGPPLLVWAINSWRG